MLGKSLQLFRWYASRISPPSHLESQIQATGGGGGKQDGKLSSLKIFHPLLFNSTTTEISQEKSFQAIMWHSLNLLPHHRFHMLPQAASLQFMNSMAGVVE